MSGNKKHYKTIQSVYFNVKNPASFGGKKKLKNKLGHKVSDSTVSKWLSSTDTYTLHKPLKKNFPRRKYIVSGINSLWQCDLTDLPQLTKFNNGHRFILLKIDCFTKKASAEPLKSKSAKEVTKAFKIILMREGENPNYLQTDRGKEFLNSEFQALLKDEKIMHYVSHNQEIKASLVERLQRTIKSKLFRYFTHSNSYKYLDVLPDIITSYNNSVHSSLGVRPTDVTHENQELIWQRLYNPDLPDQSNIIFKFKINDKVRISKYSTIFTKSYLPLWSQEAFSIAERHSTNPPVYSLKDESGAMLQGTFYEPELQKIIVPDVYKIEAILGKRKINGRLQYLVRWQGYSPAFDSYIDKRDLVQDYKN